MLQSHADLCDVNAFNSLLNSWCWRCQWSYWWWWWLLTASLIVDLWWRTNSLVSFKFKVEVHCFDSLLLATATASTFAWCVFKAKAVAAAPSITIIRLLLWWLHHGPWLLCFARVWQSTGVSRSFVYSNIATQVWTQSGGQKGRSDTVQGEAGSWTLFPSFYPKGKMSDSHLSNLDK